MPSRMLRSLLALIVLVPLTVLLVWSVALRWPWPSLLPAAYTNRWWLEVFTGSGTANALWESVVLGVLATFMAVALALPLSRLLARHDFFGKLLIEILVLAPLVVPSLSAALGLQEVMLRTGIRPSFAAVLAGHVLFILPYGVIILREGWRGIRLEVEQQARILGANSEQTFMYVALPLLMPSLALATGFGFIVSLSQYLPTLLLGGGQVNTLTTILLPVIRNGERGPAAALATIFVLAALAFCLLLSRVSRRFFKGLIHE